MYKAAKMRTYYDLKEQLEAEQKARPQFIEASKFGLEKLEYKEPTEPVFPKYKQPEDVNVDHLGLVFPKHFKLYVVDGRGVAKLDPQLSDILFDLVGHGLNTMQAYHDHLTAPGDALHGRIEEATFASDPQHRTVKALRAAKEGKQRKQKRADLRAVLPSYFPNKTVSKHCLLIINTKKAVDATQLVAVSWRDFLVAHNHNLQYPATHMANPKEELFLNVLHADAERRVGVLVTGLPQFLTASMILEPVLLRDFARGWRPLGARTNYDLCAIYASPPFVFRELMYDVFGTFEPLHLESAPERNLLEGHPIVGAHTDAILPISTRQRFGTRQTNEGVPAFSKGELSDLARFIHFMDLASRSPSYEAWCMYMNCYTVRIIVHRKQGTFAPEEDITRCLGVRLQSSYRNLCAAKDGFRL